ncbi:hypothetical protein HMPREF0063_11507 [Aeromicrobium marinum DSM 15272]|uniref:Uncharacterized protein n=1 Tax=Aeromicrobium marinum DSM 15272 TaxID=585531 RepID=E2SBU8_9ACTN|nr:hypothetical protein HMPREF0063_11507 [Aeromicrobium marinum DSM 15272]
MGDDDRNEGDGPGECLEHAWKLKGVTIAMDGAHEDYKCLRCGAVSMQQSGPGWHPGY